MACYDYERASRMGAWPLIELLHCYLGLLRRQAADDYERALLHHTILMASPNKWKQQPKRPAEPAILKRHVTEP